MSPIDVLKLELIRGECFTVLDTFAVKTDRERRRICRFIKGRSANWNDRVAH